MRIGSLFSGAGGLDLAVEAFTSGETVWQCEQDPDASKVLAARWGVPNLGDITAVDWHDVEPVDVLCGGFPCQDISNAGKRAGITGTRSGLWSHYADAIRVLRPRHVYVENVGALLVRGIDTVVGDLAALGYDATWGSVRAADAGAPHRRERVFILATDAENVGHERAGVARRRGDGPTGRGDAATDADSSGREGHGRPVERPREFAAAPGGVEPLLPTPTAADGERRSLTYCRGNPTLIGAVKLLLTPTVVQGRNATSGRTNPESEHHDGWTLNDVAFADKWGDYAAAVARWEPIIGRPAPEPVDPKGRLSPVFVEWLMGWPDGHVTGLDLKRTAQLRILGNGVVPQQALLAFGLLEAIPGGSGLPDNETSDR